MLSRKATDSSKKILNILFLISAGIPEFSSVVDTVSALTGSVQLVSCDIRPNPFWVEHCLSKVLVSKTSLRAIDLIKRASLSGFLPHSYCGGSSGSGFAVAVTGTGSGRWVWFPSGWPVANDNDIAAAFIRESMFLS